jgi:hypothetical protein
MDSHAFYGILDSLRENSDYWIQTAFIIISYKRNHVRAPELPTLQSDYKNVFRYVVDMDMIRESAVIKPTCI